ncbi:MAG: galactose-1-phosphate uridylyltransferase [Pseudomonadota bacterium]
MPELRKDPVIGRWVIISTERAKRPHDFNFENDELKSTFCPFCSGHEDKTPNPVLTYFDKGKEKDNKWSVRVVPNKFPALRIEGGLDKEADGIYDKMNGVGAHEVIIESPEHERLLSNLGKDRIALILKAYQARILDLKNDTRFKYVLIFKNQGKIAGASLEHSHSQLIALPIVPVTVEDEILGAKSYYEYKERCVFCDIVKHEIKDGKRIIEDQKNFVSISPYAPRFSFETWILPKKHASHFESISDTEISDLASILDVTIKKIDKALNHAPYNFILHTSPLQEGPCAHYHYHLEIIPKLIGFAGFELGSGFYINPTPPEDSAKYLRELEI